MDPKRAKELSKTAPAEQVRTSNENGGPRRWQLGAHFDFKCIQKHTQILNTQLGGM